jgi:predicted site-specific integrase-resolvase
MTLDQTSYRVHPDTLVYGGILKGQRIGYIRVSSFEQNPERQLDQVLLDKVFTDKASGKDTRRPELEALLSFVREGDTVVGHEWYKRLDHAKLDLGKGARSIVKGGIYVEKYALNLPEELVKL